MSEHRDGDLSAAVTAYIGLGSNLSDPVGQVGQALTELGTLPRSELIGRSALYRTAPVGPADQPVYVNAVAGLHGLADDRRADDRTTHGEALQQCML